MNESEPPVHHSPKPTSSLSTKRLVTGGFSIGAAAWCAALIPGKYIYVFLLFDCFALPLIATILACIPPFRKFGLGLLLAAGLGWLVLVAICGAQGKLIR
jgi:hypothetical protein